MKFVRKFDRYLTTLYFFTIAVILATSYFTFKEVINSYNKSQHQSIIPLFSIVNSEIVRPLNVAFFMANDPLLNEFVEQDALDKNKLQSYLTRLSNSYQMLTFIALEKHDLMLDSKGKASPLASEDAEWYHRLKGENKNQFADIGNAEDPHLYFDVKLYNATAEFIGFVGVAVDLNHFEQKFHEYSDRFGFELIFVDHNNDITISSNHLMKTESHHRKEEVINISQLSWYQQLLSQEKVYKLTDTVVAIDDGERVISQMPIQELSWRMFIISPPASEQNEYWQLLLTRTGFFFLLISVLYLCFYIVVDYFKNRLVADSETDFLTQLPNRSFLNWKFEQLANESSKFCVVIADIDHFKEINDKFGHLVGDEVLKAVAGQFNLNLRRDDICGRWGGEEFVMLLPEASIGQAYEVIERLRESIANMPFKVSSSNASFNVTISFGISFCDNTISNLEALIKNADSALYQAKANGRNRTEIYQEESSS